MRKSGYECPRDTVDPPNCSSRLAERHTRILALRSQPFSSDNALKCEKNEKRKTRRNVAQTQSTYPRVRLGEIYDILKDGVFPLCTFEIISPRRCEKALKVVKNQGNLEKIRGRFHDFRHGKVSQKKWFVEYSLRKCHFAVEKTCLF